MEKRKCKVCGQLKTEAEFSKSYPGQCKQCVARKTRENRAITKITQGNSLGDINIPGTVLDDQPDWEQRRYEIAKGIFTRCLAHEDGEVRAFCARELDMIASDCVREADALIKALKNTQPNEPA